MNTGFLTPQQLPYPGAVGAVAGTVQTSGEYQPPARDGLFNSIFTPNDLPYPVPIVITQPTNGGGNGAGSTACSCCCPTQSPSPSGPAKGVGISAVGGNAAPSVPPTSSAASAPTATSGDAAPATAPPGQIIINVGAPAVASAPAANAPSPTANTSSTPVAPSGPSVAGALAAQAAAPTPAPSVPPSPAIVTAPTTPAVVPSTQPVAQTPTALIATPTVGTISGTPAQPSNPIVMAYSYNPRLRARHSRAQDDFLTEALDEDVSTLRLMTKDATPLAFVVPSGCDSVSFFLGPIELNPDLGDADDIDQVVTVGGLKVSANAQCGARLLPGDQVTVTVPWRWASSVELAADHLRIPVYARFHTGPLNFNN